VSDFFLTGRTEWAGVGGLLGMALTKADQISARKRSLEEQGKGKDGNGLGGGGALAVEALRVHGPPNLLHCVAAARRFVFRTGGNIYIDEFADAEVIGEPGFVDHNIKVWALRLRKKALPGVQNQEASWSAENGLEETAEDKASNEIRQSVVNSMFFSDWRRDALFETALKDVRLPIKKIWIRDPETKTLSEYSGPLPGGSVELPDPDLKVLVRRPWPGADVSEIPKTIEKPIALSYIISTHPVRGKFLPQKAKELKVRPGPNFSKLVGGEAITLEDGTVITPDQVMGEPKPGKGFAVFDIPTEEYIESFFEEIKGMDEEVTKHVEVFFWMLGPGVCANDNLRSFMEAQKHVKHIIASPDHNPNRCSMTDVASTTSLLQKINPFAFRPPLHNNDELPQKLIHSKEDPVKVLTSSMQAATMDLSIKIKPEIKVVSSPMPNAKDIFISTDVMKLAQEAKNSNLLNKESIERWAASLGSANAEIITLGTGSAIPSKYRNVSSTLVRVPGVGCYLIDCGENTAGQLQRVFTPEELTEVLQNLKLIWISHLHADHHLGTVGVMKMWYDVVHKAKKGIYPESSDKAFDVLTAIKEASQREEHPPLAVICGDKMSKFLTDYAQVEDFGLSRSLLYQVSTAEVDIRKAYIERQSNLIVFPSQQIVPEHMYPWLLGANDIQAVFVEHCYAAQAVSLSIPTSNPDKPFKVAYSGDCRPSAQFAVIGHGADVLIHEATFDDDLEGDARAKNHSTTGEALLVAEAMAAKAVVLTHFSQRYQKVPIMHPVSEDTEEDSSVAEERLRDAADRALAELVALSRSVSVAARKSLDMNRQNNQSLRHLKTRSPAMKVCVAFDYMRIKAGDIAKMEAFAPALTKLLEEKTTKDVDAESLVGDNDASSKPTNSKKLRKRGSKFSLGEMKGGRAN
jgi:ribonuclease Z